MAQLGTILSTTDMGAPGGTPIDATVLTANTVLKADVANTPLALSVPVSTFVGRSASGSIAALTAAQAKGVLGITPTDVSGFDTQVRTSPLNLMGAPSGMLNFNNQTLNNVGVISFNAGGWIVTDMSVGLGICNNGQKLAFWGNTPVFRDTGWTVGSFTPFRAGISSGLTLSDVANALSTLITVLKGYGLLG